MRPARFFLGWVGSAILANVVAVTAVSFMQAESAPAVLSVAVLEGCCLGLVQRVLLRSMRRGLEVHWLYATVAGALAGRAMQFAIETGPLLSLSYRWPEAVQYVAAAAAGVAIGAVMAIPQVLVLRGRIRHAEAWVAARGAGAAAAFASIFAAAHALGGLDTGPAATFAVLLAVFGSAGAVAGAIEGSVLSRLLAANRV